MYLKIPRPMPAEIIPVVVTNQKTLGVLKLNAKKMNQKLLKRVILPMRISVKPISFKMI